MSVPAHIYDEDGKEIDPIWQAEFRGFFWGEGTIACSQNMHFSGGSYSFSGIASIGLRDDDGDLLREFHRRLGGRLRVEKYRSGIHKDDGRTIIRWAVGVAKKCERVGHILAGGKTTLPFNKKRQLDIWRRSIHIKVGGTRQTRYSPEDKAYLMWAGEELKRLRRWSQ